MTIVAETMARRLEEQVVAGQPRARTAAALRQLRARTREEAAAIPAKDQVPNAAAWRALEEEWRQHLEERQAFERVLGLCVAYVKRSPG